MKNNSNILRDILTFTLGILLIIYSTLNFAISPAPEQLKDIPSNYGKTYSIPVISTTSTEEELERKIKRSMNNSYILVILSLVGGLYLVLTSMWGVYNALVSVERLASQKQFQKQLQTL